MYTHTGSWETRQEKTPKASRLCWGRSWRYTVKGKQMLGNRALGIVLRRDEEAWWIQRGHNPKVYGIIFQKPQTYLGEKQTKNWKRKLKYSIHEWRIFVAQDLPQKTPRFRFTLWSSSRWQMTNAGGAAGMEETRCAVGGDGNQCEHGENPCGDFSEN